MPELKLGLNDKLMYEATGRAVAKGKGKAVEMEDIKFHQCVRLARFENDRTISFIPPDGEFDLMTYRLATHVKPLIWVEVVVEPHSRSRIEYMIKAKSQFKSRSIANNVEIVIPVPIDVDSPSFKSSIGSVTYVPDQDAIVWTIKQFNGSREYLMRAHFGLPSVETEMSDDWKKPIQVCHAHWLLCWQRILSWVAFLFLPCFSSPVLRCVYRCASRSRISPCRGFRCAT